MSPCGRSSTGCWCLLLAVLVAPAGGWQAAVASPPPADAIAALRVYPPVVQLDSARDRQRLLVQGERPDGVTIDLSTEATLRLGDPAIAAIEPATDGRPVPLLKPLGDGTTQLIVECRGLKQELAVRVTSAATSPPLSFRLDVMPVFARGGCNMGSCHGAARGKDGFRLSLFGFDPAGDYQRITRELPGRRLDLGDPADSLLVQKAVGAVAHTGGKRFAGDSDLAKTLIAWIAAEAADDPDGGATVPALTGLDLYPPHALLEGDVAKVGILALGAGAQGLRARREARLGSVPLGPGAVLETTTRFLDVGDGFDEQAARARIQELIADGASGLAGPTGLVIQGDTLFTASIMDGAILQTDLATDTTQTFADIGVPFEAAVLAGLTDDGLIVGSPSGNGNIYRFTSDGTLVDTYASGLGQIGGIATVPEPGTFWLVAAGCAIGALVLRRRAVRSSGRTARCGRDRF